MTRAKIKEYLKALVCGILIGLVISTCYLVGKQVYFRLYSNRYIEQYKESGDITELIDGYYYISKCWLVTDNIASEWAYYTKEIISSGRWDELSPDSKYIQENEGEETPEIALKYAYLYLAASRDTDEYIKSLEEYFPTFSLAERVAYTTSVIKRVNENKTDYDIIEKGYIHLTESSDMLVAANARAELNSFRELVNKPAETEKSN